MADYQLLTAARNGKTQGKQALTAQKLKAMPGMVYQLVDPKTGLQPDRLSALRKGADLQLLVDGQTVLTLEDFYATPAAGSVAPAYFVDQVCNLHQKPALEQEIDRIAANEAPTTSWKLLDAGTASMRVNEAGNDVVWEQQAYCPAVAQPGWTSAEWLAAGVGLFFLTLPTDNPVPRAPAPSTAPDLTDASDTGASNTDNATSDNTPSFNLGKLPSEAKAVILFIDGQQVAATSSVDANGNTIVTPNVPLSDGTHTVTYQLVDSVGPGPTSPSMSVAVDTSASAPGSVTLPEAADNVIDGGEASNGSPIVSQLPNDAKVGDKIVTHVTPPGGAAAFDLVSVLTADDLAAGSVTQTISASQFKGGGSTYLDGSWATSTTLVDVAGNTSAAVNKSFTLDSQLIIQGSVTAGVVTGGATIYAYDNAGNLLGSAPIGTAQNTAFGQVTWRITKANMGDYRGAILVKVVDSNGNAVNYADEVSAAQKSLNC